MSASLASRGRSALLGLLLCRQHRDLLLQFCQPHMAAVASRWLIWLGGWLRAGSTNNFSYLIPSELFLSFLVGCRILVLEIDPA